MISHGIGTSLSLSMYVEYQMGVCVGLFCEPPWNPGLATRDVTPDGKGLSLHVWITLAAIGKRDNVAIGKDARPVSIHRSAIWSHSDSIRKGKGTRPC